MSRSTLLNLKSFVALKALIARGFFYISNKSFINTHKQHPATPTLGIKRNSKHECRI